MRTTTVPAQITTVEDKIVGEISLTQLMLLVAPIFVGSAVFVVLPPFFASATYKIIVIVCLCVIFGSLAIRIKGRILLAWLTILIRYNSRPRYHIFDKNDPHLRDISDGEPLPEPIEEPVVEASTSITASKLSTSELALIEQLITNPDANLHFVTGKKGELRVHITEVK